MNKKRGRLYKKKTVEIITDVVSYERTKNGKTYEWWHTGEKSVSLKKIKKELTKRFGLHPAKIGLLISWSIRDGTDPETTFKKYKKKLLHKRKQ